MPVKITCEVIRDEGVCSNVPSKSEHSLFNEIQHHEIMLKEHLLAHAHDCGSRSRGSQREYARGFSPGLKDQDD